MHEFTLDEYQEQANKFINFPTYESLFDMLENAAYGFGGEGGEFIDIIKKIRFHGHPRTEEVELKLKKELGDILWYVAQGCYALQIPMSQVARLNIQKLTDRHGEKFSEKASQTKDESKEAIQGDKSNG